MTFLKSPLIQMLLRSSLLMQFVFCFITIYSPAFSQSPNLKFIHISNEQGLSNSTVECIFQDSRGFIWIGTLNGLNRYDGIKMVSYKNDPKDSTSISDNYIRSIYEDRNHTLWVGTNYGLNKFNLNTNTFVQYKFNQSNPNSLSNNSITNIFVDSRNNLWVSTTGGLNLLDRKRNIFKRFIHDPGKGNSISSDQVNCIYEDSQQNLWVGTVKGLNLFNRDKEDFSLFYDKKSSEKSNFIRNIEQDKQGNLWLGTEDGGVNKFNFAAKTFKLYKHIEGDSHSLASDMVLSLLTDKIGHVWIGTVNGGINLFDPKTDSFIHYHPEALNPSSLSQKSVSAMFEDKQGNIWVGTHRGGVNVYVPDAGKFALYRQGVDKNSLSFSDVKTFCEDKRGNVWVGTDGGGLNLFNRETNTFTQYHHSANPKSISSDAVLDLLEDKAGNLWIGTWEGGLNLMDKKSGTFTSFKTNPKDKTTISANFVQKIFQDSKGTIWIGTYYGGLNILNPITHKFTRVVKDPDGVTSLTGTDIVSICEDKSGNIWFGTDNGGLNRYNYQTKRFSHYFDKEGKTPDLRVLFTDSKGRVWVGQSGLYVFNGKSNAFTLFADKGVLSHEFIKGITEDDKANLWISTSNGLFRLNPETRAIKEFNTGDGLQGMEFEANAFLKAKDGEMFFGGENGLNTFYPKNIRVNEFRPPVYITGLQIFNKDVFPGKKGSPLKSDITLTNKIALNYTQTAIAFNFAALNYVIAENNQYAYKLENFDKDWINAGTERRASYTNLDPGTYTFRVKASNNDGFWNEKGASVQITITPPYWETWWFRILAVSFISLVVYLIYRGRVRNIERQKRKLEKQVAERTVEVVQKAEEL
jgi:ligand-binding sensor domain-containing protein